MVLSLGTFPMPISEIKENKVRPRLYLLNGHGSGQNWSVCGVPVIIKHGGCARAALRHQSRAYTPLVLCPPLTGKPAQVARRQGVNT